MNSLNQFGQSLRTQIIAAQTSKEAHDHSAELSEKVHIVGAGAVLTAAYEQLRNAAENAEEHVLVQRAIQRFFRRLFVSRDTKLIARSGEELAIELTHAGYQPNDSIAENKIDRISQLATEYYAAYSKLQADHPAHAEAWTIDALAAEVESLIHPNEITKAFVQISHTFLSSDLEKRGVFDKKDQPKDLETALYVAICRSLLKADPAMIRLGLLNRFAQRPDSAHYASINQQIDALFQSSTVEKLLQYVDRRGASLRILNRMMHEREDMPKLLEDKGAFLLAFEHQAIREYSRAEAKINRGIMRSLVFLVITKFLLGIAIEIPYDYIIEGRIIWLPLLINLLFPPIYMVLLRLTMQMPGPANTRRLVSEIETMLYAPQEARQLVRRRRTQDFGIAYEIVYIIAFAVVFGGVAFSLWYWLEFSLVHLMIFFIFLSAASFLGFRLSRQIRELETIDGDQNGLTTARDFLYMPFVVTGRWLSDKYSRVNIITMILDMLIELPLKTILRLTRQWTAFISSKQDRL